MGHAHGGLGKVKVETEAAYQVRTKLMTFLCFLCNQQSTANSSINITERLHLSNKIQSPYVQFAILFMNNVQKDLHRILQVWWLYQDNMSQLRIMWRPNMISIYSKLVTFTELLGN